MKWAYLTAKLGMHAACALNHEIYKRIASLASVKKNTPYSKMINWIRCRLSFSLLRSSLLCIRGTRSHTHNAIKNSDISIELALSESHLN